MFTCATCGGRHKPRSGPATWCTSPSNPEYVGVLIKRHTQGYHGKGTGGHHHCPLCRGAKSEQLQLPLQMSIPAIQPVVDVAEDICGCQG